MTLTSVCTVCIDNYSADNADAVDDDDDDEKGW